MLSGVMWIGLIWGGLREEYRGKAVMVLMVLGVSETIWVLCDAGS